MRRTGIPRVRVAVFVAIFGIQAAAVVYARFVPTRYLCWAPYDQISFYRIEVTRGGQALAAEEITARYRMPATGRENRSIHHVFGAIEQYESTRGRRDPVSVRVTYRTNGRPDAAWTPP